MVNARNTRRLVLIRHAKAVEDTTGEDHARRLSERGRDEATALGAWLLDQGIQPDLILCSTAARTRETLELIGMYAPTILSDKLYLATPGEMHSQIQSVEPAVHTLMLIGHNPGTHALLGSLVGHCADPADSDRMIVKFPTSACAILACEASSWRQVTPLSATLKQLRIPRAI